MQTGDNFRYGRPLGQPGGDFMLGKDGAGIGNLDGVPGRQRKPAHLGQLIPRVSAITSRKRPVPAAHLSFMTKFDHLAFGVQLDSLGILSADIDDDAGRGEDGPDAPGMAGDLGNLLVGKGNIDASVTGGHDKVKLLKGKARLLEGLIHHLEGQMAMLGAGGADDRSQNVSLLVHD